MTSRVLALLLAGAACLVGGLPLRAGEEPRWDRDAAARYLDGRMDVWWANAKTLRTPWRTYSLNYDREHGGPKGEPWRRMFMSDLATAFGVLALL